MSAAQNFKPGTLVSLHQRQWVVMPSAEADLLILRPLGGTELETRTIWLNAANPLDEIKPAHFAPPEAEQIGDFASARLLYNAARLLFRNGAGPFRSVGKISVRPRAFQLVPLIMALRQETVRLMIADDVGVGKTIESLLVARELLDRGMISRIAVLCPPHLCEQWQTEMLDKFGLDAVVVRSGTWSSLERQCNPDETVFERFDLQIISIDLVKRDQYKALFMKSPPDLVVVDEAHTCSRPSGKNTANQQQRYALLAEIAKNGSQHFIMLTATPHSGKPEEFQSLLGLLKPDFENITLTDSKDEKRKELAKHFVQRRRKNIESWVGDDVRFPKRDPLEENYSLHPEYKTIFAEVRRFAKNLVETKVKNTGMQRLRYYAALAILRGVMSSPRTGAAMLRRRADKKLAFDDTEYLEVESENAGEQILEAQLSNEDDATPTYLTNTIDFSASESTVLNQLAAKLAQLEGIKKDIKADKLKDILEKWVEGGFNVLVYCRFIDTANYLGEVVGKELVKKFGKAGFRSETITSELADDQRKEKILEMADIPKKVLFATDCMSEGINLQEQFNAVIHYDLPWNPNRLEQREGRVDRFGQNAETVRALLLIGSDNPMDGVVLRVLLRKAREIRRATGITVPLDENSASVMDAVLHAVLLNDDLATSTGGGTQLLLFELPEVKQKEALVKAAYERAEEHEKRIATIFAQEAIHPNVIEDDLRLSDEALGKPETVKDFVTEAIVRMGGSFQAKGSGHRLLLANLPQSLRHEITTAEQADVSFFSPVPEGLRYLGRNHPFVEQLCHEVINAAFSTGHESRIGRVSAFFSSSVAQPTTLYLLRVRSRIEMKDGSLQQLAEEMMLWGFQGSAANPVILEEEEARRLIFEAVVTDSVPPERRPRLLGFALKDFETLRETVETLALGRAEQLVEAHERHRKHISGERFRAVKPVLPPDLLGVFILLPEMPNS